jgi:hypothetical protein
MADSYRALIARSTGPSGGTLLHLVRAGTFESMCAAFPVEKLKTAGGFDEVVCPDCLIALRRYWQGTSRRPVP